MSMNTTKLTNNEKLRQLVESSGLTQKEALALFNAPLGPAGYSLEYWKGFFCKPGTSRYKPLRDDLLTHAEKVFLKIQKRP